MSTGMEVVVSLAIVIVLGAILSRF